MSSNLIYFPCHSSHVVPIRPGFFGYYIQAFFLLEFPRCCWVCYLLRCVYFLSIFSLYFFRLSPLSLVSTRMIKSSFFILNFFSAFSLFPCCPNPFTFSDRIFTCDILFFVFVFYLHCFVQCVFIHLWMFILCLFMCWLFLFGGEGFCTSDLFLNFICGFRFVYNVAIIICYYY